MSVVATRAVMDQYRQALTTGGEFRRYLAGMCRGR
jgi:hypothetical protein